MFGSEGLEWVAVPCRGDPLWVVGGGRRVKGGCRDGRPQPAATCAAAPWGVWTLVLWTLSVFFLPLSGQAGRGSSYQNKALPGRQGPGGLRLGILCLSRRSSYLRSNLLRKSKVKMGYFRPVGAVAVLVAEVSVISKGGHDALDSMLGEENEQEERKRRRHHKLVAPKKIVYTRRRGIVTAQVYVLKIDCCTGGMEGNPHKLWPLPWYVWQWNERTANLSKLNGGGQAHLGATQYLGRRMGCPRLSGARLPVVENTMPTWLAH